MAANRNKTVVLLDPPVLHGQDVKSIMLREPTGADLALLGEPRILIRNSDGAAYWVEQPAVVAAYMERCVQHELGADVIKLLSLADTMEVKSEVLGFFREAEVRIMEKRSTASSSAPSA